MDNKRDQFSVYLYQWFAEGFECIVDALGMISLVVLPDF